MVLPRLTIAALLVALAACGSSAGQRSSVSQHGPTVACGPASAHTVAAGRLARVYSVGATVYGCSNPAGKSYRLGQTKNCIRTSLVGPVKVAGKLAAYGLESCGVDTGSTQVVVRRLSDGEQLLSDPAITSALLPESYQSVASLVLRGDGAVAWIAAAQSIVRHSKGVEVHKAAKATRGLLDYGPAIDPRSLTLRGSTLTWKHGQLTRSARLG
jgi:hypothetical protein